MSFTTNKTLVVLQSAFLLAACAPSHEPKQPTPEQYAEGRKQSDFNRKVIECLQHAVQQTMHPEADAMQVWRDSPPALFEPGRRAHLFSVTASAKGNSGVHAIVDTQQKMEDGQTFVAGDVIIKATHSRKADYMLPGYTTAAGVAKSDYEHSSSVTITVSAKDLADETKLFAGKTVANFAPGLDAAEQEKITANAGRVYSKTLLCVGNRFK